MNRNLKRLKIEAGVRLAKEDAAEATDAMWKAIKAAHDASGVVEKLAAALKEAKALEEVCWAEAAAAETLMIELGVVWGKAVDAAAEDPYGELDACEPN